MQKLSELQLDRRMAMQRVAGARVPRKSLSDAGRARDPSTHAAQ
jgi:hypothetical protein